MKNWNKQNVEDLKLDYKNTNVDWLNYCKNDTLGITAVKQLFGFLR